LLGAAAGLLALPLALSGCSSDAAAAKPASDEPAPATTSASASPAPPARSVLSGRLGVPDGPVYAVKVDNTTRAHPQVGLTKADVVYIEQVEGGVTRLAAIFSSSYPKFVGPVRSGRITDIEMLKQYGTVGLMYSGSQDRLLPKLLAAPLKLVSFDASPQGYTRSPQRPMPYDVIGTFSELRKRAGKVSTPTAVGYEFADAAPAGGRPASHVTVRYPFARVDATWSPARKRWLLAMDGVKDQAAEGGQLGPTTFVVQFSTVRQTSYKDINGVRTPMTKTVGSGRALIFRDGQVYEGQWQRDNPADPTTYTVGGAPAVFAPGQIWVALIGRDRPVTVR
jgi:DUF3048 family protein